MEGKKEKHGNAALAHFGQTGEEHPNKRVFDPRVEEGDNPVEEVIGEARDRGALVGSGRPGFQIMIAPPLCASEEEIAHGVEALESSIKSVFGER